MKKDIMHHCSATPEDQELSLVDLTEMHRKVGISPPGGYHVYVRRDGTVYHLRPFGVTGAHCRGSNRTKIGVCYEGGVIAGGDRNDPNHAADTRTPEQKEALIKITLEIFIWNKKQGADLSKVEITGHRDESPDLDGDGVIEPWEFMKQCPCFDAIAEYDSLRKSLIDLLS